MIFLLDENVDQPIAERLRQEGHEALCASEMEPGVSDEVVLSLANEKGAVLITGDKHFGELVFRYGRAAHGVLLVRLAGLSPRSKADLVSAAVRDHGQQMRQAFTVLSRGMIRIRRT